MPKALDPVPKDEEEESGERSPIHRVFKGFARRVPPSQRSSRRGQSAPSGRVSFEEYEDLLRDRPFKFAPSEVGYQEAEGDEKCGGCFHFFTQGGGDHRRVCEILRLPGDEDIDPEYKCQFQTADGENYPLLEGEKDSSREKEEKGRHL